MRQTLLYIPPEIAGVPIFGFGLAALLLLVAVLVAGLCRYLKTKKIDADIWSYFGLLFVGSAILIFVAPKVLEPEGFPIRGYGVCLLVAILASLALVLKLSHRTGTPADQIFSLCLWAVVSGIFGARMFYVVEYWPEMIVFDAISGNLELGTTLYNIVNIANGGLVVFGSILGGILGSCLFMLYARLPVLATFDSMAPAMMLGIAIGRIGCFLNGCCFGGPSDMCWAVQFPVHSPAHFYQMEHGQSYIYGMMLKDDVQNGTPYVRIRKVQPDSEAWTSGIKEGMILRGITGMYQGKPFSSNVQTTLEVLRLIDAFERETPERTLRFDIYEANTDKTAIQSYYIGRSPPVVLPVHPTQIYSSLAAGTLCLFALFLWGRPFFRARDGMVFSAVLMLYSIVRFCLEIVRTDEDSFQGTGLTVSQNISIGVFLCGLALTFYLLQRGPRELYHATP